MVIFIALNKPDVTDELVDRRKRLPLLDRLPAILTDCAVPKSIAPVTPVGTTRDPSEEVLESKKLPPTAAPFSPTWRVWPPLRYCKAARY